MLTCFYTCESKDKDILFTWREIIAKKCAWKVAHGSTTFYCSAGTFVSTIIVLNKHVQTEQY